ncbi:hypothetical protein Patl1_11566 [Pistacia atlantica]|uniref:Uncharacterized protein n=1 Tax=Pistacia atlantica TaxID=434234 RepID=A0ACC1AAV5_9ROSI|nr:hypothetical protein Patl1_11566 [Pistacia atlantica]
MARITPVGNFSSGCL